MSEKLKSRKLTGSVPTKILVPLLEKASLEEPSDSTMIDLWSNLLVSAGLETSVPPRYVHIVGELNSRQANLFMEIVTKGQDLEERDLANPVFLLRQRDIEYRLDRLLKRKRLTANDVYVEFMDDLEGPCVALTDLWVNTTRGRCWLVPTNKNKFGDFGAQIDIQILSSLGLFDEIRVHRRHELQGLADITIFYFLLTEMGLDFFQAVTGKFT